MTSEYWTLIEQVKTYLDTKETVGVEGMKKLLTTIAANNIELIVITFTYETLEIYLKKNNQFELNHDLADTLNRYKIEAITEFDYNCDDEFETFQSDQIYTITSELIKSWLVECYQIARDHRTIKTKIYFKEQYDQMEIFELNSCQTFYEKTEFDRFVKNNQTRLISLLQS